MGVNSCVSEVLSKVSTDCISDIDALTDEQWLAVINAATKPYDELLNDCDKLLGRLMKEVNWGASAISGETLGLLNETLVTLERWKRSK